MRDLYGVAVGVFGAVYDDAGIVSVCHALVFNAVEEGLTIIPVLNKIDLDQSDPERVKKEIEERRSTKNENIEKNEMNKVNTHRRT